MKKRRKTRKAIAATSDEKLTKRAFLCLRKAPANFRQAFTRKMYYLVHKDGLLLSPGQREGLENVMYEWPFMTLSG